MKECKKTYNKIKIYFVFASGTTFKNFLNSAAPIVSNLHSLTAVTVAVRRTESNKAISPKLVPAPLVATTIFSPFSPTLHYNNNNNMFLVTILLLLIS